MKITAWHVETDPLTKRRLGKACEELAELQIEVATLLNILSRCLIQGIDEVDPSSGVINRERLWKEVADVQAQLVLLIEHFELPITEIHKRILMKLESMSEWERLLKEEENDTLRSND